MLKQPIGYKYFQGVKFDLSNRVDIRQSLISSLNFVLGFWNVKAAYWKSCSAILFKGSDLTFDLC